MLGFRVEFWNPDESSHFRRHQDQVDGHRTKAAHHPVEGNRRWPLRGQEGHAHSDRPPEDISEMISGS